MTDKYMKRLLPIFFGRDRGMGFFLAFLVLMTIIVPTFNLSRPERLALTLIFALTLVSGALVTIGLRILRYVVIALTIGGRSDAEQCRYA